MRTTICEPFNTIRRLQDEMNRAFGSAMITPDDNSASAVSHWIPAVDVHEETDRYVIVADIPGVKVREPFEPDLELACREPARRGEGYAGLERASA